ncbi:MAG TPA: DUF6766 family protein [Candidatus Nitrosocosmicus sp.]|nr:DUF6766 family protein [Candidatus Nitrosocosmicus sp.]
MKKFIMDNSLSIVLLSLFFVFLMGLFFTGASEYNEEQKSHNQPIVSLTQYVTSSHFAEAVFENWESEFLQMWALVILTIYLKQKGSADSKKLKGKEEEDTSSRYSLIKSFTQGKNRGKALLDLIYSHSLGYALLLLFIFSFLMHGLSGVSEYNQDAITHGEEQLTFLQYLASTRFWFESFQNWQSEFLAVGCLLILSIFLRQRGSPESKPIGEPNKTTGN